MLVTQLVKFAIVGVIATAIHFAILIALTETALSGPVLASGLGFSGSAIFNYLLNHRFTFASRETHRAAVIKFALVAGIGLGLNSLLMLLLVHVLGIHYLIGQVLAAGCVFLWNFFANRAWTYRAAAVADSQP